LDPKEEVKSKGGVAFKTINEELHSSEDESSESNEDSTTMITRELKKIFKSN